MGYDAHKNLAYSTLATAPSPATSGTSLVVQSGDGALFPAVPFNATVWVAGSQPLVTNAEIVRVTAISGDTFTIVRAQEGTSARTVLVGDQIAATITAKTLTDVETAIHNAETSPARLWREAISPAAPTFPVSAVTIASDAKYNAFPWVAVTKFGKLIAIYREGASHTSIDGKITINTSTDGGATWSGKTYIASPAGGHDYRDPSIVSTRTGRLIVNFFDWDGTIAIVKTMYSDDAAATWSSLVALSPTPFTDATGAATSAGILQHSTGLLVMPIYGRDTGDTQDRLAVVISGDDGLTWTSRINVTAASGGYSEASLVEFADGSIHAFIRNNVDGKVYTASSSNLGLTWGSTSVVVASATAGRPTAVLIPVSQALVVFYRKVSTALAVYRYSFDYGASWSSEQTLISTQSMYAGACPLNDKLACVVQAVEASSSDARISFSSITVTAAGEVAVDPIWTAKGDLAVGTGAGAAAALGVGSNGTVLTADSAQTDGMHWVAAPVTSAFGRTGAVVAVTGDYYGAVAAALTGATQAARFVGSTTSGAPASGTFAVGDFVIAQNGHIFVCTVAGSPGTWVDAGSYGSGGGSVATDAIWTAKAQLAVATGSGAAVALAVGSDGQVLTADSAQTDGVKWATPGASGTELDYVQRTSNLTVTATTAATAQSVVDGNAVSYDGSTRVKIEFWAGDVVPGSAGNMVFELWDGSTDLGAIVFVASQGSTSVDIGAYGVTFLTPSNASHTYHVKVWKSGATGTFTIFAGSTFSGSAPTADAPVWYRITRA